MYFFDEADLLYSMVKLMLDCHFKTVTCTPVLQAREQNENVFEQTLNMD